MGYAMEPRWVVPQWTLIPTATATGIALMSKLGENLFPSSQRACAGPIPATGSCMPFFHAACPRCAGRMSWIDAERGPVGSNGARNAALVLVPAGVIHPPAGAACLIYVSASVDSNVYTLGWMYLFLPLLASDFICVVDAMLWNNLSKGRQHPVYW